MLDQKAALTKIIEDAFVALRFGQDPLANETHLANEAAERFLSARGDFSIEAERHGAALLACNRILKLAEDFKEPRPTSLQAGDTVSFTGMGVVIESRSALVATPPAERVVETQRHPLEAYADSYAQIARMGDGKVDCRSVEIDIRQNMIPVTTALATKPAVKDDETVVEALRKIEYCLTKDSLCEAEKIDDALSVVRRTLASIRGGA